LVTTGDLRERTANAVFTLLGGKRSGIVLGDTAEAIAQQAATKQIFAPEEKDMIQGVLTLAERPAKSIMTPRTEIDWLDIEAEPEEVRRAILGMGHSRFPLARGSLDDFIGVALAKDLLRDLLEDGQINLERSNRQPLVVHESVNVLRLLGQLRKSPLQMAIILDEHGALEGIVTPLDVLGAIAGEFPDEDEDSPAAEQAGDGSWLVDGAMDIRRVSNIIGTDLVDETDRYSTLAGYIFWQLGYLPTAGEHVVAGDLAFEVVTMDGRSIEKVRISAAGEPEQVEGQRNRHDNPRARSRGADDK
jgi:CBS domain containing-hemolysin-like protein